MNNLSKEFEYHLTKITNTLMLAMEDSEYNIKFIELVKNRDEGLVESVIMLDTLRFGLQSGKIELLNLDKKEDK